MPLPFKMVAQAVTEQFMPERPTNLAVFDSVRRAVSSLFSFLVAIVLGVPGILLALQVGLVLYKVELAFDWALWVAEHSPLPLSIPAVQLANYAIQRDALIPAGLIAAFLCLLSYGALRNARGSQRPADESDDGKGRIELKAQQARVGRPLEGRVRLTKEARPGDVFRVELSCRRRVNSDDDSRWETPFFAQQDVQAVQGAEGWSVPFRFEVPATAPHSTVGGFQNDYDFNWQLGFFPAKAWIATPSRFSLQLAAASEEDLRRIEAGDSAALKDAIGALGEGLGRGPLLPYERAQLRALPPEDLEMASKVARVPAKIMKWVFVLSLAVPAAILAMVVLVFAAVTILSR